MKKQSYTLGKPFPEVFYEEREVTVIGGRRAGYVRAQFHQSMKENFRATALETCTVIPSDFDHYHIHHILPVSLGGRNEPVNLALVQPFMHKQIHKYIDGQVTGAEKGDCIVVRIPLYKGLVWGPMP